MGGRRTQFPCIKLLPWPKFWQMVHLGGVFDGVLQLSTTDGSGNLHWLEVLQKPTRDLHQRCARRHFASARFSGFSCGISLFVLNEGDDSKGILKCWLGWLPVGWDCIHYGRGLTRANGFRYWAILDVRPGLDHLTTKPPPPPFFYLRLLPSLSLHVLLAQCKPRSPRFAMAPLCYGADQFSGKLGSLAFSHFILFSSSSTSNRKNPMPTLFKQLFPFLTAASKPLDSFISSSRWHTLS